MKLILLSGGSGKRLWPLSNDARSKQFLKVLNNGRNELESMVQRVWTQLQHADLADRTYIATGRNQVDMIRSQLGPEVPTIVEPERRDTFPAIALASAYLSSVEGAALDEVAAVLPVDPFVDDSFFGKVKELEAAIRASGADVALIGVKPTEPSEKYGYIVPGTRCGAYATVSQFVEKPRKEKASQLVKEQALWNCGVFAFRLGYIVDNLARKGFPARYEDLLARYGELPAISFDYEVVEKAERVVVCPYDGQWKDLGTWNTLTEEVKVEVIGNGSICAETKNTHVINELSIPVLVMGASDLIVSASPDGILVADKSASPRVKELLTNVDQRPMYEERPWGTSRVLDYRRFPDGGEALTQRLSIEAGRNISYHFHLDRSESWTILAGVGEFVLNERATVVGPGDVLHIPPKARHSIKAIEKLEIIEVQSGSELTEEDVNRISASWDEIAKSLIA